jgi:hypothetical protein
LGAEEIFARFCFIAFLNFICYETPKNAIKKKSNQTADGEKKYMDETKATFSVMSPDGFSFFPLRNAKKTR